jgi:PAS domain S-box-containing protein
LRLVRTLKPDLPFVIVSGTIGEEQAVEALKGGADDYVMKDRLGRLGAALRRAIDDRRVRMEKARAQADLEAQTHLLRLILDCMSDGLLVADGRGELQFANPAARRLMGDALLAKRPADWTPAEGLLDPETERVLGAQDLPIVRAVRGQCTDDVAILVRRPDHPDRRISSSGRPILDADGAIRGAVVVWRDVTEEHEARRALAASEKRYREIFLNDLAGHFASTPEGRLLTCNPAFARMFGFESVEAALRADLATLYADPLGREEFLDRLRRAGQVEQYEWEGRRTDGGPIWTIENTRGVFDDDGRLVAIHGSIIDITRYRQIELQLRHAQKMDAVGRLAAGVAHDFNNLLTIITGYAAELMETAALDDQARACVQEITDASRRAAALTRQLLAFGRRRVMQPRVLDLNAVIRGLEPMLKRLLGERVSIRTELGDEPVLVRADEGSLEQVLTNLAVNARDAMPRGGTLTISARRCSAEEPGVPQALVGSGLIACLSVADTGEGIDERTLEHIFEPFFTTKPQGRGTGLGLSVVDGIVAQFGGAIAVHSVPGEGSTFHVCLPLASGAADAETPPPPARAGSAPRRATVLVAEDDDGVRALARLTLEREGYRVIEAADGVEALSAIETSGSIDVIIADVVMPGLGGVGLAQSLAVRHPDIRLILMSGYPQGAESAFTESAAQLEKPFTPQELVRKVREVLGT